MLFIFWGVPKLRKGSGFPLILRHRSPAAMASPGYPLQSLTRKTVAGYRLQVAGLLMGKMLVMCLNDEVQKLFDTAATLNSYRLQVAGYRSVEV
ncbi:hypothetical protein [Foetidibacter luteolus]|uniref:hypothetical protein n=1 Tax=Foetidibacter luteolus TaxID=2608880 RepID=UPI00129AC74D|nr:hypothetical protein [Foetidibacter luteolus]